MPDIILTGASRGIGRALALELGQRAHTRLFLIARDAARLQEVAARCRDAQVMLGDLGSISSARELGERLAQRVEPGAVLVHNAGIWPARLELTPDGYERSYAVNCAGPLALQAPLLAAGKLARVLVVSAGLIVAGRPDPARTPQGADFSKFRSYANSKRAFAEAIRALAPSHPEIDFLVLHPGVVRTDLGARSGLFGKLIDRVKRRWESPEVCAARLGRILQLPRWSSPGQAAWFFEERAASWPIA
ncbi:MAG TPA: SDR family NAD(P)-dependent oxidoreductase [Polyangiales bacterium]|nr:SDR family NAD(P)-dependent oxidoreductase [Polyangiales bacterium]